MVLAETYAMISQFYFSIVLGRTRSMYTRYSDIAMRIALGLGMHRSTSSSHVTPFEQESRRLHYKCQIKSACSGTRMLMWKYLS
ncbi:hypothetical protein F4820DRAFT_436024 [Hypoxylon rubiginosum]|uniref:Uncharacterized protein n=1 Tax=Hypoxylon rubiginosum TaxID=110542 RepID=A0ACB9YNZ4_9PEZI|nr:hypothetical protein F4820DRAFT_436024 [Hypoxylon rubiginosum]